MFKFLIILFGMYLLFSRNQSAKVIQSNNNIILSDYGIIDSKDSIIVIGDLHADFLKTKEIFVKLKLIDNNDNWIGGNTTVIQVGDQLDGSRGFNVEASGELELLNFMEMINYKANKSDGAVYSLIGNHEFMNLMGYFRYASKEDIKEQEKIMPRRELFKPGGIIFGELSKSRFSILKIGNLVFSHAGVHNDIIDEDPYSFIIKINMYTKMILNGEIDLWNPIVEKYFMGPFGILMNRELSGEKLKQSEYDDSLKKLNCSHQIIGHTIQDNINSVYDGKLYLTDIAISGGFGYSEIIQVMQIQNGGKVFKVIEI